MSRYIAFLRAINVGGHTVTMAELRRLFEELGFRNAETFIASGNVIFTTGSGPSSEPQIAGKIERHLQAALGFEVKTFLRTPAEVAAVAAHEPFPAVERQAAGALCVGFLAAPLGRGARDALMAMKTDIDEFHVHGREVYWLCRKRQSESTFTNVRFEKALGVRSTFRGVNTVAKLAAKYLSAAAMGLLMFAPLHGQGISGIDARESARFGAVVRSAERAGYTSPCGA